MNLQKVSPASQPAVSSIYIYVCGVYQYIAICVIYYIIMIPACINNMLNPVREIRGQHMQTPIMTSF